MPVLSCQKNNKPGHKWGKAGVCFTGPDSRERALAVGRAIAAKEAQEMRQRKDQALGSGDLGGFLVPDDAEAKLLASGLGLKELTAEILGALTKDELNAVHDHMHELFQQFVDSKGQDTDEGKFKRSDFDSAHQLLQSEFTNRGMKFPVDDEINAKATKKAGQTGQAGVNLEESEQISSTSEDSDMSVEKRSFPVNSRGWTVQETFGQMIELDRKYTQDEQKYEQPSPDSNKTCGACRFFLREEQGAIGSCQVVGGPIAWFGTCDLYISASAEAVAAFAAHPDEEDITMGAYTLSEVEKVEKDLLASFGLEMGEYTNAELEKIEKDLCEQYKQEGGEGIKFVIGRLKGETKTTVQSVLFDKEIWTLRRARAWLKENDLKSDKLDETEANYRFRQRDPGDFKERSFRTITPGQRRAKGEYGGPSDKEPKKKDSANKTVSLPILKVSPDGSFVVAPILVPNEPDLEGDVIEAKEIEVAAHDFMEFFQNVGLMHKDILNAKDAVIVESSILRGDITVNGTKLKKGTWIGAFKIHNDKLRDAVKTGKLTGVSIGGVGTRSDIAGGE